VDRRPEPGSVWSRLRPAEQESILTEALRQPDLSTRELAFYISDHVGFAVSESTVYRILKRHGLHKERTSNAVRTRFENCLQVSSRR
jgi:transposase